MKQYVVSLVFKQELDVESGFNGYVGSPDSAYRAAKALMLAEFGGISDREWVGIIALDTKNCPLGIHMASVGTLNAAIVSPREIFKFLCLINAASFIMTHNHPSGDTKPSGEDIKLTERINQSAKIMGISLLDHLVLSFHEDGKYSSIKSDHPECFF